MQDTKKQNYHVDKTSKIGRNCKIYPGVIVEKNCVIGNNVTIQTGTFISGSVTVKDNCFIGPFSVLRDNTTIDRNTLVGPHCEITRSKIGKECKVAHRTYIGDATIGKKVFFGCGVVIANTDFKKRYPTKIGDNSRIGASVTLISPITIGTNCFVGAGTILAKNLKPNTKIRQSITYSITKN